ncbi:hypothetical protein P3S67_018800 [Capsicum chacoense]|uniref:uncharacterized protein LOC107879800 n=1 Tax=Capsicum annuum TaxID=4072 RepID=UPI0007BEABE1|nr:uncharacterized protein LOC107879800 [Capsicum annuum]
MSRFITKIIFKRKKKSQSPYIYPILQAKLKRHTTIMMTSFCNKKVHPFLCVSNSKDNGTLMDLSTPRINILTTPSIGGDISAVDTQKPTSYVDSGHMTPPAAVAKKDPGGIGFLDEVGGSVDGLMSCTESLGFESSDERTVDDQIDHIEELGLFARKSNNCTSNMSGTNSRCWQRSSNFGEKKEKKEFPPPLSSLSQDGKPNFFMRAVRKDGRLELTEVKIDRPETLRASRQDGRLRLHFIRNLEEEDENYYFPAETEERLDDEEEVIETDEENDDEEEEEDVAEWKFPVTRGGSRDCHRRCYGRHHDNLHVWRQRCVTTR